MARRVAVAGSPWRAAAVVAAVAGVAWLGGGHYARRQVAAQLPALQIDGAAPAVGAALAAADAQARQSPSASTIGALAAAYHAHQRPAAAIAVYRIAAALAPTDPSWTYLRGVLHEERGDSDEAQAAFTSVVGARPGHGHAWFRLGELAFKRGRLDEAAAAYARARDAAPVPPFVPPGGAPRQVTPLAPYARLGLARVALDRGDAAAAVGEVGAVIAAYPGIGAARGLLREAERAAGGSNDPPGAARGFASPYVPPADPAVDAVIATSVHTDVLLKFAGLATRAGDAPWREFLVRRALAAAPDDRHVVMEMATMLQAQGRPAEALDFLRRHETLAPGDHHTLVEQGRCLLDLGRLAEAEAVLRRAVDYRDAAAEYNLASALDRQDRWHEARAHYERALSIDPYHVRSMNNLAIGLDRRGQTATAMALLERAIAIAPGNGEFYVNYGTVLIRQGRIADAVRVLDEAVALSPRDANAHNNRGIALARHGDLPRARDAFARAVDLDPRHEGARGNLAQVTAALGR